MGQRLATVVVCLATTTVSGAVDQKDVGQSALEFFEGHDGMTIDEFLTRLRPSPITEADRARILASLPARGGIHAGSRELAKMSLGEEVLAYHARRGLITFQIIDVAPAFVGLYERAVILVSARALPLINREEFAGLVAHELGHEYFWTDYQTARQRHDGRRLRELELRCDGIAVLTMRRLGLDPERLVRAVEMLTWYNQQRRLDSDWKDYVSRDERRAFIRAVENLRWVALNREP